MLLFALDTMDLDIFLKPIVSTNVKRVIVKEIDVGNQFTNGQEFESCDYMLQWIRTEASKLGFGIVIERSDNGSYIRGLMIDNRVRKK